MGYELYITRAEFFWETQENPIAEEEWLAVAGADSDLQLDTSSYLDYRVPTGEIKRVHPWILKGHPDKSPFWFRDGAIFTTYPDHQTIAKMVALAKNLNAQVIGEEGEVYETVAANDPQAIQSYRKMWIKSVLQLSAFFLLSSVVLGLICRFPHLDWLTSIFGLLLGWILVTHGYIEIDGQMTIRGDLLLLGMAFLVIWLAVLAFISTCNVLPGIASCAGEQDSLRTTCIFGVSFPLGISSFSLWLWFRIRQFRARRW